MNYRIVAWDDANGGWAEIDNVVASDDESARKLFTDRYGVNNPYYLMNEGGIMIDG